MALFRRRLRAVKGWSELVDVIIDMQEVLEIFASDVSKRFVRLAAEIPVLDDSESTGAEILMDEECPASLLNFVPDKALARATVIFTCPVDTVRNGGYLYFWQGSTKIGQMSMSAGTVTAANKMVCAVWQDGGLWFNRYLAPGVGATTANWAALNTVCGIAVDGGIDKITTSKAMPTGARVTIVGEYGGE